jgi:hypothetical protein
MRWVKGRHPQRFIVVAALFLFVVPVVQWSSQVGTGAEVYTCGSGSSVNYHAGYGQSTAGPNYVGASARILTEYGAVCDTQQNSNNFTAEYSMVDGQNTSGHNAWAQSGYIRWYNSGITYFAQQNDGFGHVNTVFQYSPAIGETHTYIQKRSTSTGFIASIVDSTTFLTTNWDPEKEWSSPPTVEFSAEAAYLASDIAGSATTPVQYSSLQGQLESTNNFANVACSTLYHKNDGAATRTDGESWHDIISPSCPSFINWTGTAG